MLRRPSNVSTSLLGEDFPVAAVLLCVVNPLAEEVIARAYAMTEIAWLSNSRLLAVVCSVALQASYHLYQGVTNMLVLACVVGLLAVHYAAERRAWPVILRP